MLPPIATGAPVVARKAVLAQLAQDPTDEHFPLLIYEGETITDFTLTTRFKTVNGVVEQMAGIAFRIQNETNYYVVRASSLGNNVRFYKVVNGQRGPLIGPARPDNVAAMAALGVARTDGRMQRQRHPLPAQRQRGDHRDGQYQPLHQRKDRLLDEVRLGQLLH